MSLVHPRVAHNYAKAGFYPTDQDTVDACLRFLQPPENSDGLQLLDPCCGEGEALAALSSHLSKHTKAVTFGVEYDAERAYSAKESLSKCIHADINDCVLGSTQFSLLWLNPPYGDKIADHSGMEVESSGRKRLEKQFFQRCYPAVAFDGVMVLLVPDYALDKDFRRYIGRSFKQLTLRRACDSTYKQVVLIGTRKRTLIKATPEDRAVLDQMDLVKTGDIELPNIADLLEDEFRYVVPALPAVGKFQSIRLDPTQLSEVIGNDFNTGMWPQFHTIFNRGKRPTLPPLCQMSEWHMALALAAGQLNGLVSDDSGRQLLVKGDTHKAKKVVVEKQVDDAGNASEVRVSTDTFVPSIVGLDFTPGSEKYGNVVRVQ